MKTIPLTIIFLSMFIRFSQAQWITTNDDYDVIAVPVGGARMPISGNYDIGDMFFAGINGIDGYENRYQITPSIEGRIDVHLHAGDGVQIWSERIPVSAASVYFSCIASVSGEPPLQAALAIIDGENSANLGVSISLHEDIPRTPREFSLEYDCRSNAIHFLIQLIGPQTGETVVTLQRFRVLSGYKELDFTLGTTSLTPVEHFGNGIQHVRINTPPSTVGTVIRTSLDNNRTCFPETTDQSLVIGTLSENNVIQVMIPLQSIPLTPDSRKFPLRLTGQAFIKRLDGNSGIVSIGLFSGTTGSIGYTDFSVASIPSNDWLRIESPVVLTEKGAESPFLVLQIRNGRANIAVDDVSLHARRDSPYFWNASLFQPAKPPILPVVEIPTGTFQRGSRYTTEGGEVPPEFVDWLDEIPQRAITITKFYADRHEISNQAYYQFWQAADGGNRERHTPGTDPFGDVWPTPAVKHPDYPVVSVSWNDAMAYCAWRSNAERVPAPYRYRLPTEAEWEYMARGTSDPPHTYPWGFADPDSAPVPLANYQGLNDGYPYTAPVTAFAAGKSTFEIYNLAGNVWEWCLDWYDAEYYRPDVSPDRDPLGPASSPLNYHVIRGGSWNNSKHDMRVAHRVSAAERGRSEIGFRCVISSIQPIYSPTPTPSPTIAPTNTPVPLTPTPLPLTPTPVGYRPGEVYRSDVLRVDRVYIPHGSYLRGNNTLDEFGLEKADESPRRELFLDGFLMDRHEVYVGLYRMFLQETGSVSPPSLNDAELSGDDQPIVGVTYNEALRFCEWRTAREGLPLTKAYRLPTEAEWEYAARGSELFQNQPRIWPWGQNNPSQGGGYVNFSGNTDGYNKTSPVNAFHAGVSPFLVLNLAGNAAEWCLDWYDANYYQQAPVENPLNSTSGEYRAVRGGSWQSSARAVRCAARDFLSPDERSNAVGFRCVRTP
jgi:iron(II)-dependent oxidoreductase